MRNVSVLLASVVFAIFTVISPVTTQAADQKVWKILIKAATTEVNGQQFADSELDATVKDLRKATHGLIVTDNESEADFLLVVVERKAVAMSGQPASKTIVATLSVRDGAAWKPATKLQSGVGTTIWRAAAEEIIIKAEKWLNANVDWKRSTAGNIMLTTP
jgi:hypothetical protein